MPSKVTLFDDTCKPVYDLGSGPYSYARWNPFGRFFIIAGFGNLPGRGKALFFIVEITRVRQPYRVSFILYKKNWKNYIHS
jgi:hypothetical protein